MNAKITVLGGSGMLGAMVTDFIARQPGVAVSATVRSDALRTQAAKLLPHVKWQLLDAEMLDTEKIKQIFVGQDWVVNAIGVIKPYIHDDNAAEVERATRVNSLFPHLLAKAAESGGCRVLQIATDCVYSGKKGHYVETDAQDALDAYGKTKSLGEVHAARVQHLRCSIIGPEPKAHVSLLDWFCRQPEGAKVNGFLNHQWNGVTTLHYAKLCHGIIAHNISLPHLHHVVPTGEISKCDMLRSFAASFRREDIAVNPTNAAVVIDRTLATTRADLNAMLWNAAGYPTPPTVPEMISELGRYQMPRLTN